MGFHVVYVAGGELDKVRRVEYVNEIKNFAQLSQPYNKMKMINIPAIAGVYDLDYISPDEDLELLSFVVTCTLAISSVLLPLESSTLYFIS